MFLVSHTTDRNTNIAQARIDAKTEAEALAKFAELYPDRQVSKVAKAA